jgi:microcystin degradation protein MlrC
MRVPVRLYAAGLSTETNTFAPWPTGTQGFAEEGPYRGDVTAKSPQSEMGMLAASWASLCRDRGLDFVEGFFAHAHPSGRTVQSVYETLRDAIVADVRDKGPFDVVLLFLHGAMAAQDCDDCEGDLLARLRAVAGPGAGIGAVLDPHCHLTPLMVEQATAIVLMKEYPHIDYIERGRELFEICVASAQGKIRPVSHLFDMRMVGFYPTTIEPMRSLVLACKDAERRDGVLSVSFAHGFPWGDTPETGSKMLAIADGDAARAQAVAAELGQKIYAAREALLPRLTSIADALAIAAQATGLAVLADVADNPGGGAPGDNVALLRAMLEAGLRGAAFGCVWDPMAVRACQEGGVGATFPLRIGGKSGEASGDPLDVVATVKALRDNHDQHGLGPSRAQLGDAAWIQTGGIDVVLSSVRTQVFAPDAFTGLGMTLEGRRVVAVKSSRHFEAGFKPIAERLVAVATPGAIQMDFAAIPYRRKRDMDFFPRVPDPLGLD